VEIREVRPKEYEAAGRVTALAYSEFAPPGDEGWSDYLEMIADVAGRVDRTLVLVAVDGDRVVGSATIELDGVIGDDDEELPPDVACLRMLGVDPSMRDLGLGRALVQAAVDRSRAAGKRELILRTTPMMVIAAAMYRSMGFERDPELDMADEGYPPLTGYRLTL
jgi:ribosomal protein S18 acetylase RimI-like enzyme